MPGPIRSYQDLNVWRRGMRLAQLSYRLCARFPKHELYGLASQIRRASVSIPANIAEGYGRSHRGDYVRYLSVANGSLKELETELILARTLEYVRDSAYRQAMQEADELGRMLRRLLQRLREKAPHPTP